jgi:hypothetical protein
MAPRRATHREPLEPGFTHLRPYGSLSNSPKMGMLSVVFTRLRNSRVARSGCPRAVMITLPGRPHWT